MVKKIIAKYVATFAPVAAHVERANVSAFLANVVNVVVLDNMVVATEQNAVVWAVVNQIVFDALSYACDMYTRLIAARPLSHVMYVIVCGSMSTWLKHLSITSR